MPVTEPVTLTAALLSRMLQEFLASAPGALVMEDGAVVYDLAEARYSVAEQHGKCLLHLWSAERNAVRRVLEAEIKRDTLELSVLRFGQARPTKLEICPSRDRRSMAAKNAVRAQYQRRLRRMLEREFGGHRLDRICSAWDLERSFGPVYARGLLRRGSSALAVIGVNAQEAQASVDNALTIAILWLEACREANPRICMEGVVMFVPPRTSDAVRTRMAHLRRDASQWRLFEFDERAEELRELDCADRGNVATRLVHCPDEAAANQRFAEAIARVRALAPEAETAILAPNEIAFRLRGLEFARARLAPHGPSFRSAPEVIFGLGAEETVLSEENAEQFSEMVQRLARARRAQRGSQEPLWRVCPERWLESLVLKDIGALDTRLDPTCLYSQVPAFSASDRAMIDVLAVTRQGRLAVVELKAEEDLHLPLQGLDYWARVRWHQERGEFQKFGYFRGRELSPEPPLLLLVAPALHLHPTTDTLLRYLAPEIDWTLIAVDERWREGVRVVFRKRPEARS